MKQNCENENSRWQASYTTGLSSTTKTCSGGRSAKHCFTTVKVHSPASAGILVTCAAINCGKYSSCAYLLIKKLYTRSAIRN